MSTSIALSSIRKVHSPIALTATLLLVTLGHGSAVDNPVWADQPNKQARQKVSEGLDQYSSGNYEQAAKSFAEAAEAAPDNPIIKFDEACAVSAAGDDDKARELLLQASLSSDPQVSAAACYNLAAIAAKRGRKELGEDPMAASPEARQAALEKLKIAVTHYRDCLRIAPEHLDARHNLELVLTLANYLQQQWQMRDHQQALEKMSLFELLKHLDDQQLSLRSTTLPYKGQSAAKVSRFDRSKMANQQLKLLDDLPTLKSKIDAQLANNPEDAAQSPNGTPRPDSSQQSEVEAQLRKIVTEQLDQASQAMRQAAEDVRSANWDRVLERQRFTSECFRQLQALFSAFPENLDLAIELQESLIETKEHRTPSSTKNIAEKTSKKDDSTDGQAWQQDWVSNFSQSLAAKATATLQSLPEDEPESQPEEPAAKEPQEKDTPESDSQSDTNRSTQTKATQSDTEVSETEVSLKKSPQTDLTASELEPEEVSELTPEQQQLKQQEEFTKQFRKALERTVELAPTILERSNESKRLIIDSQRSAARPAQEDVLRMLKEIRDLLPKQPNQKQDQTQNQDQKQNQNQDQNKDQNKDQKSSDQNKQNEKQDSKSDDQKQNPENGQDKEKDKEQDKSKNSDKPDQNDGGDKSQTEKKPDTEKPQPKDKTEEAEKKSAAEQSKEQQSKEQAAKESEKTNSESKPAEQTAQQIAEQRAQAVLRRIREREAKYRELLQQLRERQAQQTPVEKDW